MTARRKMAAIAVLLVGLGTAQAADLYLWAKRMQIHFPGYAGTGTLTNFPALVVFSNGMASGFSYADFASGTNTDLRFTDSTLTNELNYEVESWNTNGSSIVWVQVRQLTNGASIWAFWGLGGQTAPACRTNGSTWDRQYRGVWHLNEASGMSYDSTTNHNNGTNNGSSAAAAQFAGGRSFSAGTHFIDCGSAASLICPVAHTVSAWIKPNSFQAYGGVFSKSGSRGGNWDYLLCTHSDNGFIAYDGVTGWKTTGNLGLAAGNWYHVAYENSGGNINFYINGVVVNSQAFTHNDNAGRNAYIGSWIDAYNPDKVIDEVRLSDVAAGTNWIWASYMNQASNSVFVTNSAVEEGPGFAYVQTDPPTNISLAAACLNGTLWATGATETAVFVFYGPSDAGTNAANWGGTNTDLVAPQSVGAKTVTVTLPAGGETFYRYAASNAAGLVWADSSQYLLTTNVTISVTPAAVGEAYALGTFQFVRPETLTGSAVTVTFTIGGTASNGTDYSQVSASSVTIPAGATSAELQMTTLPDGVVEGNETLDLTETAGAYVLNAAPTTTLTIADSATVTTLLPSGVTASSATLNGSLSLDGAAGVAVVVYYGPTDGGTNAANWAATNTTLIAPQGDGAKPVAVVLNSDEQYFYRYAASNTYGLVWATSSQYLLTTNVVISVTPGAIAETNGVATFQFARPATLTNGAMAVNFTLGGTAVNGIDYGLISVTNVTLAAGAASVTLQLTSLADTSAEVGETVTLTETVGAYVLNVPAVTTLTITDSSIPPWTASTNTVVLQQGAYIVRNGLAYGDIYTNTVDTYIDRANPTNNYASAPTVQCIRHNMSAESRRGYLRFNSLQSYVPSNAVIRKVWLELTSAGDGPYDNSGYIAYRTADWSPSITWNSPPADAQQKIGWLYHFGWGGAWPNGVVRGLDISSEAQGWLQGTLPNYGLIFRSDEGGTTYTERSFYSSDEAVVSRRPKLTIVYALPNEYASPAGYAQFSPLRRRAVALSGTNIILDTYVNGDSAITKTSNYVNATTVNLKTRNSSGVKRALLKLNTSSGLLATFAKSTTPTNWLDKRLARAWLRVSVAGSIIEPPSLWTCNQDWDPATATFETRDGVNAWSQVWVTDANQNVGSFIGTLAMYSIPLIGGCDMFDITAALQAWIDGSVNNGLILGHTYADYDNWFALSEFADSALQPTLVLEYYELPPPAGSVFTIR